MSLPPCCLGTGLLHDVTGLRGPPGVGMCWLQCSAATDVHSRSEETCTSSQERGQGAQEGDTRPSSSRVGAWDPGKGRNSHGQLSSYTGGGTQAFSCAEHPARCSKLHECLCVRVPT